MVYNEIGRSLDGILKDIYDDNKPERVDVSVDNLGLQEKVLTLEGAPREALLYHVGEAVREFTDPVPDLYYVRVGCGFHLKRMALFINIKIILREEAV